MHQWILMGKCLMDAVHCITLIGVFVNGCHFCWVTKPFFFFGFCADMSISWLDLLLDGDSVTTDMVMHYLLGKVLSLFYSIVW